MHLDNQQDFEVFLLENDKKANMRTASRIKWMLLVVAGMAFVYMIFIEKKPVYFAVFFSSFIVIVAFISERMGNFTARKKHNQLYMSLVAALFYGVILYIQPHLVGVIGWGGIFLFLSLSLLYINRFNTYTFGILGVLGSLYISTVFPNLVVEVNVYTYLIRIAMILISTVLTVLSIIEVKRTVLERESKISEIKGLNNELTTSRISLIKKNRDIEEATDKASLLAYYYDTTGLPNYEKLLKDNEDLKTSVTVLSFDINRFQLIREFHDEEICTNYIIDITEQMTHFLTHITGGLYQIHYDDFVYVINQSISQKEVEGIIKGLESIFHLHQFKDIQNYNLGFRIGVADNRGSEVDMAQLIKRATITKNSLKSDEINAHAFYNETIEVSYQREVGIKEHLNKSKEEMFIVLQPIVDLENKKIKGFEALLRWVSSIYGFISPGEFIPYAEENMTIVPIGYWVLEEACKGIKRTNEACNESYSVSINVSSVQLLSDRFVERFMDIVKRVGVDPRWIIVELTENVLIESFVEIATIMQSLRNNGIGIALDDFGTGYSSMAYLHQLPIDILKIDRSFVLDMEATKDTKMIEVVIKMAHQLDELVVVEGVEQREQFHRLRVNDCDYIQGYYFSKPLELKDFPKFIGEIKALEEKIRTED